MGLGGFKKIVNLVSTFNCNYHGNLKEYLQIKLKHYLNTFY